MVMPTIENIYKSAKIAETKRDFQECGYQEYFNGLYTVNDIVSAFVELYDKNHNAKEVFISMDGFIPETAPEAYCLAKLKEMYEELK